MSFLDFKEPDTTLSSQTELTINKPFGLLRFWRLEASAPLRASVQMRPYRLYRRYRLYRPFNFYVAKMLNIVKY